MSLSSSTRKALCFILINLFVDRIKISTADNLPSPTVSQEMSRGRANRMTTTVVQSGTLHYDDGDDLDDDSEIVVDSMSESVDKIEFNSNYYDDDDYNDDDHISESKREESIVLTESGAKERQPYNAHRADADDDFYLDDAFYDFSPQHSPQPQQSPSDTYYSKK